MGVRRDCMRDQIRRELLKRIANGTYRPGDRLVELHVAKEFNTSQAPVREAFRELEALRLVECETYRGTRVRAISLREMRESALVRGVLEDSAAVEAGASFRGNSGALRETLDALEEASRAGDTVGYAHQNLRFHRQIVEAAGNEVLLRVWDSLMLEARTLIGLNTRPHDLIAATATHRPILDALDLGDGLLAGRLLREHAEVFAPRAEDAVTEPLGVSFPGAHLDPPAAAVSRKPRIRRPAEGF